MAFYSDLMKIQVEIVEARDLLAGDRNGFSDPYVILDTTEGLEYGARTPTIKKTLNPVWNYKIERRFSHTLQKIRFRVMDYDRFSKDDPLGQCTFRAAIFNDGVPIDIWEPIVIKPKRKSLSTSTSTPHHTTPQHNCNSKQTSSIIMNNNNINRGRSEKETIPDKGRAAHSHGCHQCL